MGRFRIKISSTWFSEDYILFRYSTNGVFWKNVKCCVEDIPYKWYYVEPKTSHFSKAKYLLEEFNTLEKVKQYEAKERAKCKEYNAEIIKRRKIHKENLRDTYNQYG